MHENLVDIHVFIMFVEYIFADTMSHDKETNADVALASTSSSNQTCTYS